jgi:hypothetical protein
MERRDTPRFVIRLNSPEMEFGTLLLCSELCDLTFRVESGDLPREKTTVREKNLQVIVEDTQAPDKRRTSLSDGIERVESLVSVRQQLLGWECHSPPMERNKVSRDVASYVSTLTITSVLTSQ